MKVNESMANGYMIAGMGGFGCKTYDCASSTKVEPADGRHIAVIQAYDETTVESVEAAWDAPADVAGVVIPAGACLFVRAKSVTISAGYGVCYYGNGVVYPAGE